MENKTYFEELKSYLEKKQKLNQVISLLNWDIETCAPEKAVDAENDLLNDFYGELIAIDQDPNYIDLVKNSADNSVNERQEALLTHLLKDIDYTSKVDAETLLKWNRVVSKCCEVWRNCKQKGDYETVRPYFAELVEAKRQEAKIKRKPNHRSDYEALLEDYEPGLSEETLDKIFGELRVFLQDNLAKALEKQAARPQPSIKPHPKHQQQQLTLDVLRLEGFDFTRGAVGEAEHPFTDWPARFDFRVTTHYYPEDWRMSLYSVLHEGGHAIHGQMWPSTHYEDFVNSMATNAICETHSRFFENIIGRSEEFAPHLLSLCKKDLGGEFESMGIEEFLTAIRHVEPSLVRTEADEYTYCLHIIIRYELERDLINGNLSVDELPKAWNAKYREYLGIDVPNNTLGVLQDTHWYSGLFGYFPSYALGNLYGAQLLHEIGLDIDFPGALASGDLTPVLHWLARSDVRNDFLPPDQWIKRATGKSLDSDYFIDYLKKRYL